MKIYRVTIETELYVEANDEDEADTIALRNLVDEVRTSTSDVWSIEEITSPTQVVPDVLESLPWRAHFRHSEKEYTILELLEKK